MGGGDSNGAMELVAYPEQMSGYSGIGCFLLVKMEMFLITFFR